MPANQTQVYNDNLTELLTCLATTFGDEVGLAVQEKFDQLITIEGVDINNLIAQINALNAALASNTAGDVLNAQMILSQLANIDHRLDALENSNVLTNLVAQVNSIVINATNEHNDRVAAEALLQSNINAVQANVDQLSQQLIAIQNGQSNACDCAAITAALAEQATAIANLTASDAAQNIQIAALQTAVSNLQISVQAAAAAAAAANAAAVAAGQTAANAVASVNVLTTQVNNLTTQVNNQYLENEQEHGKFVRKDEVMAINCVSLGVSFRQAMRARLFTQTGTPTPTPSPTV